MIQAAPVHPQTTAVHAGRPPRDPDAPLNTPAVFASTYVAGGDVGYGRYGNPTWSAVESIVGELEGGRALAFGSGMAAISAAVELVRPDATVVLPRHCYLGVRALLEQRASSGTKVRLVDVADTTEVLDAAEGADLVWLETPTNPTMEVADLVAISSRLAGSPATVVVDNTFATPLLQQPLGLGADVVVHSATKFFSGHSDAVLGVVVVRADDEDRRTRLDTLRRLRGAVPGTMEAYLVARGLRTLGVRLERAQANAGALAAWLHDHPAVDRVHYPGLPDDPGHAVAARQMAGFGSLLSIDLGSAERADALVAAARLWVHATSLGGVESTFERRRRWAGELPSVPEGLIRLSVGIEHVEDLRADLEQAFDQL